MLLDDAIEVLLATCHSYQSRLAVLSHGLAVEIETGNRVFFERALLYQSVEVLFSFFVNAGVIEINRGGEIDFGLAHVQKTEGISRRHAPSFFGRHYVIRQFADPAGQIGLRTPSGKGANCRHRKTKNAGGRFKANG